MRLSASLNIKFENLKNNVNEIQKLNSDKKILAMVKADAYGHGSIPIVQYLFENNLVDSFGVASLDEAIKIRKSFPELTSDVYVFSDHDIQAELSKEVILNLKILPVIYNLEDLKYIIGSKELTYLPICLKFNTGMNRLGIEIGEIDEVIHLLKNSKRSIFHLMSHLSSTSQLASNKKTQMQVVRFDELIKQFESHGIKVENKSISNSGALEQSLGVNCNFIRPGLSLFGVSSLIPNIREKSELDLKLISSLQGQILQTREIKKGEPVGYGGVVSPRSGMLIIVGLGYGDGLSTSLSGCYINQCGFEGQFIGRINMDMVQILFPTEASSKLKKGNPFYFWEYSQKDLLNLSDGAKKIPYEFICQLTSRVPRVYNN